MDFELCHLTDQSPPCAWGRLHWQRETGFLWGLEAYTIAALQEELPEPLLEGPRGAQG